MLELAGQAQKSQVFQGICMHLVDLERFITAYNSDETELLTYKATTANTKDGSMVTKKVTIRIKAQICQTDWHTRLTGLFTMGDELYSPNEFPWRIIM